MRTLRLAQSPKTPCRQSLCKGQSSQGRRTQTPTPRRAGVGGVAEAGAPPLSIPFSPAALGFCIEV
jgi:hypothetical protein